MKATWQAQWSNRGRFQEHSISIELYDPPQAVVDTLTAAHYSGDALSSDAMRDLIDAGILGENVPLAIRERVQRQDFIVWRLNLTCSNDGVPIYSVTLDRVFRPG